MQGCHGKKAGGMPYTRKQAPKQCYCHVSIGEPSLCPQITGKRSLSSKVTCPLRQQLCMSKPTSYCFDRLNHGKSENSYEHIWTQAPEATANSVDISQ